MLAYACPYEEFTVGGHCLFIYLFIKTIMKWEGESECQIELNYYTTLGF